MTANEAIEAEENFASFYGIYERIGVVPRAEQAEPAVIVQMRAVARAMYFHGIDRGRKQMKDKQRKAKGGTQ